MRRSFRFGERYWHPTTARNREEVVITLVVSSDGEITLTEELIDHLGISLPDQVEVETLPERKLVMQAARRKEEQLLPASSSE